MNYPALKISVLRKALRAQAAAITFLVVCHDVSFAGLICLGISNRFAYSSDQEDQHNAVQ